MPPTHLVVLPTVGAFLRHLIDYAGLFPPAALPLDKAIALYARYRREPEQWMLSRFIVPAAKLPALSESAAPLLDEGSPFRFSILGRGGATRQAFLEGLKADVQAVATFRAAHGEQVQADVFEVRLPAALAAADVRGLLTEAESVLEATGGLRPFYEADTGETWQASIGATIEGIAGYNEVDRGYGPPAGFKLRCGGVVASAFPSSAQVAFALAASRDAGVALKATAGLHHPIRHHNESVQTKMHGFLNFFGAGLLAHRHRLDEATLQAILEDEEATHFRFTESGFAWQHLTVTLDEIRALRTSSLLSYGSCSFDEPRDDLRALGLLNGG